jgi:outer membrane protein assembly factor BamB
MNDARHAAAPAAGRWLAAAAFAFPVLYLLLWGWMSHPADVPAFERRPVRDPGEALAPATDLRGFFVPGDGRPSASISASWPRFRGPDGDNRSKESVPLADAWPESGPRELWRVTLGVGHAGPAVRNGRVYVLDHDEAASADVLKCLSLDDGREIWRRGYAVQASPNHGISRTVPAVTDEHVVTVGPRCHVLCADAASGDFRWGLDLVRDFGATEPLWYTAQCPLIEDGLALLAPAGRVLMMAVDGATGRTVWETPNPRGWTMSHSSIVPMTFDGVRMYVYCAIGGVAAVAADGADRGRVLWETDEWKGTVIAPSPVPLPGGRILFTAGYGLGSAVFEVRREDGVFRARPLFRMDKSVFACEQHTPIVYQDHLFTVMPSDAGALKKQLVCLSPAGQIVWSSGREHRFGLGPYVEAGGRFLVLSDEGVLTMARASAAAYEPLAQARILTGRDAWGPLAIVGGRLLARDLTTMVCLDLREP